MRHSPDKGGQQVGGFWKRIRRAWINTELFGLKGAQLLHGADDARAATGLSANANTVYERALEADREQFEEPIAQLERKLYDMDHPVAAEAESDAGQGNSGD
jgi:hypothetical protein